MNKYQGYQNCDALLKKSVMIEIGCTGCDG